MKFLLFPLLLGLLLTACSGPMVSPTLKPTDENAAISQPDITPTLPMPVISEAYFRFNQVGYPLEASKLALVLTGADLSARVIDFEVLGQDGNVVYSAAPGRDRGAYAGFNHLYELDFSSLTQPGTYTLRLAGFSSAPFVVGEAPYADLISLSLKFFSVQRCGDAHPYGHQVCHLKDGVASGGPLDGQPKDASGGWHDAGDYLKFMITSGYTLNMVQAAFLRNPAAFAPRDGKEYMPQVLLEMKVGLDWMKEMWDGENQVLYYQVGDESDHDEWRLPEGDDADKPVRLVWACEDGKGANIAGKAAAALAMGAVIWGAPTDYQNVVRAQQYFDAAKAIYAYGKGRPAAQPSNPADFYTEESWQDDMALAAVELYRFSGDPAYLADARQYLAEAGVGGGIYWGDLHALAAYELARLDPDSLPMAADLLRTNLEGALADYRANPFGAALKEYYWGSNEGMAGTALMALWYEDLTGDKTYHDLAVAQWDFILGKNPWGVCFVNGAGTLWPKNPHHQVADINQLELTGFWDEGAVPQAVFEEQEIGTVPDDPFAAFQTTAAVYHDWTPDYATNEPTITMNATGIALTAWMLLK